MAEIRQRLFFVFLFFFAAAIASAGDFLIGPAVVSASASSESTQFGDRIALYAVNGAGLLGEAHSSSVNGNMWMSTNGVLPQWFKVDLGGTYRLERVKIWNHNQAGYTDRGCREIGIYYSDSEADPGNPVDNPGQWIFFSNEVLTEAPGSSDYGTLNPVLPDEIDLDGVNARWVCFTIESNYGGDYCGLSEVRFYQFEEPVYAEGDIDKDGEVGFGDLAGFVGCWLTDGSGGGDIDKDGKVDMLDLARLAENWGKIQSWRPAAGSEVVLVEAENFDDLGGWVVDQQFMDQMGSPYLLAHGLGRVVDDANTVVEFDKSGDYRVWVRTFDWAKRFGSAVSPGRFEVKVNGNKVGDVFGNEGENWQWQDGGSVSISSGDVRLRVCDLTGFEGRCDAVLFTDDNEFRPADGGEELEAFRNWAVPGDLAVEDAGHYDLVVVGGGMAGICSAVSAARLGLDVGFIQDRPVLGGNNSSEVRVGLCGAVCEMPYPNVGKLVVELDASLGGNAKPDEYYGDSLKLSVVENESRIDLYLNHRANEVEMYSGRICAVVAEDTRTGKRKRFSGDYFADCTGDGVIGFLAGADSEMTSSEEGHMGRSNLCNWVDVGSYSAFSAHGWALDLSGGNFPTLGKWYWESGFYLDPFFDGERIRDLNFMAGYGAWDCMKNVWSGYENKKLNWFAYVSGKRESRRLLGELILTESDIVNNVVYDDGCVPTGWSIDVHMPNPIYDPDPSVKGDEFISLVYDSVNYPTPYWIPYRCLYSRNIGNLFMAGRDISVTHRALGTVRVQRTTGMMGEIVGMAAKICEDHDADPCDVYRVYLDELKGLMTVGVGVDGYDPNELVDPAGLIAPENIMATASSNYTSRDAVYAVNRAGMVGSAHTCWTPLYKMWMDNNTSWPRWFRADLGVSYDMDKIKVWNFNWTGYTTRGCKNIDVYYSDSVIDPGNPVDNPGQWTFLSSVVLTKAPGESDYGTTNAIEPDEIAMGGLRCRWVGFKINSGYGGGYCGLSEIWFFEQQ